MKLHKIFPLLLAATGFCMAGCTEDSPVTKKDPDAPEKPVYEKIQGFAKGADVSWLTQMEHEGLKFYTPGDEHAEKELMLLLREDCGVNSIRLRVWVDPAGGWNDIDDVVIKARRAEKLGLRTMIDFHFSDTWADPGAQKIPASWADATLEEMCTLIRDHVTEMLTVLKREGVTPEWVQIGNETTPGMLLPMGSVTNGANLAALNNAGYDAAKAVFPDVICMIHLDAGDQSWRYDRYLGALDANGGKYDMIGMSLYPWWAQEQNKEGGWRKIAQDCLDNIDYLKEKYGKPVMICEIGMPYSEPEDCKELIAMMMQAPVEGIFYWEPEAPAGYNGGYSMGCFDNGAPTCALDPFTGK